MSSLLNGLAARRRLLQKLTMKSLGVPCPRVITNDAGGTEVESWPPSTADAFCCTIQNIKRRPVLTAGGDAEVDMADAILVYPVSVHLDQTWRVLVNNVLYTIREVYDNVDTAMTNQAYLAKV